jgi:hypothetical protein
MLERVYFDKGVCLLVEVHEEHNGARVRAVLYDHPEAAQYATHLAASMNVPVQRDPGAPSQQAAPPAAVA